jgi:hypothetical protein
MSKRNRTFEPSVRNGAKQTAKVYIVVCAALPDGFDYAPNISLPLATWGTFQNGSARPYLARKTFLRDNRERLELAGNIPFGNEGVRPYDLAEV